MAARGDRFDWPRSSAPDSKPPRERLNPERVRRRLSRLGPLLAPQERHVLACEVHWERAARARFWRSRARIVRLLQSSRRRLRNSRVGGHLQHLKPKNPALSFPRLLCGTTRLVRAKTAYRPKAEVVLARAEQAPDRQVLAPGSAAPRRVRCSKPGSQNGHGRRRNGGDTGKLSARGFDVVRRLMLAPPCQRSGPSAERDRNQAIWKSPPVARRGSAR